VHAGDHEGEHDRTEDHHHRPAEALHQFRRGEQDDAERDHHGTADQLQQPTVGLLEPGDLQRRDDHGEQQQLVEDVDQQVQAEERRELEALDALGRMMPVQITGKPAVHGSSIRAIPAAIATVVPRMTGSGRFGSRMARPER
jgi:hypothetical protein